MSGWQCRGCRTTYPPGVPLCPPCEARGKVAAVAHANAHGSTHYVGEGDPLPSDLSEDVRLVGPGAPAVPEPEVPLTRAEVGKLIDEAVRGAAGPGVPDPLTGVSPEVFAALVASLGEPATGAAVAPGPGPDPGSTPARSSAEASGPAYSDE